MLFGRDSRFASFADRHMKRCQSRLRALAAVVKQIAGDALQVGTGCRHRSLRQRSHETNEGLLDEIARIVAVAKPLAEIPREARRSDEHPSELPSLMRISYAVFFFKHTTYIYFPSL